MAGLQWYWARTHDTSAMSITLTTRRCRNQSNDNRHDVVRSNLLNQRSLQGKRDISYRIDPSLKKTPPLESARYSMRLPKRNSGSLNDCIEKGPNYLELIPKLLNRFRQVKYGVISDIRRAFLQIKVAPSERKFLRFLWWEEGDPRKLIVYSHCRVFGVNASPFLLAATINYYLESVAESQKGIGAKLKESMNVDNCVASVNTIGELNSFITVFKELMASAHFDLRGWKHNRPASNEENSILNLSSDEFREIVSVLGLKWNLYSDIPFRVR
ncbi:integrase catalytic domain-containing protein [Trichonephila clavipes]|nr:integrase catalytic domain-containing protein [Trichonephila clavipes]